ncbi:hypothetical protein G7B40_018280 [Aetokthonos hydrillicola Thurmond2011]|jgi:hypothetical protein|uniref:Uncharacterized protein n=1 Tax=Aetokthonos hydrillicola Thurmond2011 TaxID=2712845 RepID=A0AAP5MA88_9CYAN|nr:hypothetical protein [Aetokthonos hydrillicola]MBO3460352.1 hypothetical protein [Aetokthonos hydrillicola CCALA 1050]MBW4588382.1 hypothetical protein [Aetokthonos hydrillicola CCALA 1050]MDR9896492.1 hypothetical protein [Aetokthonos hydrillicola Thurmond2011]
MNHLNVKTLAFYGGAIAAVLCLFGVVTAYGTDHLKAPAAIDGNYPLKASNLPPCLKTSAVVLNIEQSGRYLSGSLLPVDNAKLKAAQKKISLDGSLINQQISLEGTVPAFPSCSNSRVKIQGEVKGKTLSGQISLGAGTTPDQFTAQQEEVQQKQEKH